MQHKTYVLFGRSGSGKGTQAELLRQYFENKGNDVVYIETGQEFRRFMHQDNYTSTKTKQVIGKGGLMPAFMPIYIWAKELVNRYSGYEELILDGLCRNIAEAPVLDSALKFYGIEQTYIIHIDVSRQWASDRMHGRGRADDSTAYINARLDWYDQEIPPVLEYFKDREGYTFVSINGEQSIEDVHSEILKSIT